MKVAYSEQALADIERITEHLIVHDSPRAATAAGAIMNAIAVLASSPFLGRPIQKGFRELVISSGSTGYLVLYRVVSEQAEVMSIRHQRELGYR